MPRPARAVGSITARLVVLFTVSSAVLLGAVVGVIYRGVALHLDDEHGHLLAEVVRFLRVAPSGQAIAWPGVVGGPPAEQRDGGAGSAEKYSFRVVLASGRVEAESPGMARVPLAAYAGVPIADLESAAVGIPWHGPSGAHFLLAAAAQPGGPHGEPATVQVALDVLPDDGLLAELRVTSLLLLALGTAASGLAGAIVARHGLRPIERMAVEMTRVSAQQLQRRLDPRSFPPELHRLVDAFSQMLDRLDRAFADISAYSGNLAHELRTPLGNLRGETEVALLRARTADEYREVLSSSLEELDRLARMIDALLFLARADRREAAIASGPVSLGDEARAVVEFYTPLAEENGVSLQVAGEAEAVLDAELFRRALGNLIANALRHVRRGGRVAVEVRGRGGREVAVEVVDDGCGIAAADLPHVFERFYRGSGARGAGAGGSGLGLALVRSIVELHGGQVMLASTVGAGTRVTMVFPGRGPDAG